MDLATARNILFWCTLINYVILLSWSLLMVARHGWLHRLSIRFYRISAEQFDVINFAGIVLTTNGEMQVSVNNTISGNIAVLNCVNVVNDSNTNHFYSNDFGFGWGNSGGTSGCDEADTYNCGGGLADC